MVYGCRPPIFFEKASQLHEDGALERLKVIGEYGQEVRG